MYEVFFIPHKKILFFIHTFFKVEIAIEVLRVSDFKLLRFWNLKFIEFFKKYLILRNY
jgi:hypothetical protein